MRKLTGLAVVALAFAVFAQDIASEQETAQVEQSLLQQQMLEMERKFQAEQQSLRQQMAELEQKFQEATALISLTEITEVSETVAVETTEERKFPRIRKSGDVAMTPRMEIQTRRNADGGNLKDYEGDFCANPRSLQLTWNYRLLVEVNEKLELGLRLADPAGGTGTSVSANRQLLVPTLPNLWFTWKPFNAFNLSGGLLYIPSSTTLDLATLIVNRDPTSTFDVEYYNSLAGFDFIFPVSPRARIYLTGGITDNSRYNASPFIGYTAPYGSYRDTLRSYSDGRIILGADLNFFDNRISFRPSMQVLRPLGVRNTRGLPYGVSGSDTAHIICRGEVIPSIGADLGFRLSQNFAINASIGAAWNSDYILCERHDPNHNSVYAFYDLVNFAIEPVLNFGGENNNLFNFRARYSIYMINRDGSHNDEDMCLLSHQKGFLHFVDARFGINVAPRFSIVPRYRLWASNNKDSWLEPPLKDDKSSRVLHRLELGFNVSL